MRSLSSRPPCPALPGPPLPFPDLSVEKPPTYSLPPPPTPGLTVPVLSSDCRVATVSSGYEEATPNDVLVVLSPGVEDHWARASLIQAKTKVPTLALAPPFSLRCVYLTGKIGKGWRLTL